MTNQCIALDGVHLWIWHENKGGVDTWQCVHCGDQYDQAADCPGGR